MISVLHRVTAGLFYLGIALVSPIGSLHAAPPDTATQASLTLGTAIELALARHPSLQIAEAALAGAESGFREARSRWLPALSLDGSILRFSDPMVTAPLHGFNPAALPTFDRTLAQGGLSLSYTLFDGGARRARIRGAEAMIGAGEAGLDASYTRLLSEVVRVYLGARSAAEVVEANARRLRALEGERDRAAQLLERGKAARVQLLRAEAAVGTARAEWYAAVGELEVAEGELARMIGAEIARGLAANLAPVYLAGEPLITRSLGSEDDLVDRADRAPLLARALAASPEVRRLRRQLAAAEAGHASARALWFPKVEAVGRYSEYASGLGREQGEWQGGLQLSFPLFVGGARQAAGARALAEVRSTQAQLELAEDEIGRALDHALAAVSTEEARAAALELAVRQAKEVVEIERLALDAGVGVQTDYLSAEAELLRARAAHSAAVAGVIMSRVELARVMGELSTEWLDEWLESGPVTGMTDERER